MRCLKPVLYYDIEGNYVQLSQSKPSFTSLSLPCEECSPELLEVAKWFCSIHTEHIARGLALLITMAANAQFTCAQTFSIHSRSLIFNSLLVSHHECIFSPYNVEVVSCWLRSDSHAREVLLEQIPEIKVMDLPLRAN